MRLRTPLSDDRVPQSPTRSKSKSPAAISFATAEDRLLLVHAKSICERPEVGEHFSDSKLQQIKLACQRYSLGNAQRLVMLALNKNRGK